MKIPQTTIDELKNKHGDVYALEARGETVLARRPTQAEFDQFLAYMADEDRRAKAPSTLFHACCVHPDASAVDAMLQRMPGLSFTFGQEIAKIGGVTREVEVRKL